MKRIFLFCLLAAARLSADTPIPGKICDLAFEATVHQGPNAGKFSVSGTLQLDSRPGGILDGKLLLTRTDPAEPAQIPISASLDDQVFGLTISLAPGVRINGTGYMVLSQGTGGCTALTGGGLFSGPDDLDGDVGTWSTCVTSFFGSCTGSGSGAGGNQPPILKNPMFNAKGQILMDAGGSYIATGAMVQIQVPFSTTIYGPYPLQFTSSGTQLVGIYDASSVQPGTACRIFTVINPGGVMSAPVSACR